MYGDGGGGGWRNVPLHHPNAHTHTNTPEHGAHCVSKKHFMHSETLHYGDARVRIQQYSTRRGVRGDRCDEYRASSMETRSPRFTCTLYIFKRLSFAKPIQQSRSVSVLGSTTHLILQNKILYINGMPARPKLHSAIRTCSSYTCV